MLGLINLRIFFPPKMIQSNSTFDIVYRGNLSHATFLRNARNSEETLRKEAIERTDLSHLKDTSRLISVDMVPGTVYQVESTGAIVSLNSSVGLIHFYCSQLPSDRYCTYYKILTFAAVSIEVQSFA